jgi:hypothetical protein
MFRITPQNLWLVSKPYLNSKIRVNPRNPRLKIAKVANTGCPITMLILQNKPNFPHFWLKNKDLPKKQTQFKPNSNPIQTQTNPNLYRLGNLGYFFISVFSESTLSEVEWACQEIQFFRCQGRITAAKLSLCALRALWL